MLNVVKMCLIGAVIPVVGFVSSAHAQQIFPEECTDLFVELFSENAFGTGSKPTELTVVGTRVALTTDDDSHSFSMNVTYRTSLPLDSQESADQSTFTLNRIDAASDGRTLRFNGPFREVYPARANGTSERPSLVIFGEPEFQVVVVYDVQNNSVSLNDLICFRSLTENDFIMTGHGSESDGTFGLYSFTLKPEFSSTQ